MTDEKEPKYRRERKEKDPSLKLWCDSLERAKDNTFSTTVHVRADGRFEDGKPRIVELYVSQEKPVEVELHERSASYPLTGFEPESHHVIVAVVQRHRKELLIRVPSLPKPKRPEEEALELERIELERTKVAREIETLTREPQRVARKLYVTFRGERGRQRLVITISDETGNFIPNFPVTVVDGDTEKSRKTSATGRLVYAMNFMERDRYVEVRIGNEHDHIWRARLVGPAPRR